jgi:hypothetical protein
MFAANNGPGHITPEAEMTITATANPRNSSMISS